MKVNNSHLENLIPFVEEVLPRLASKLPEKTFETVSEVLLKELQYQQENIYVPLEKSLEQIKNTWDMQHKIVEKVDVLLASNEQDESKSEKQLKAMAKLQEYVEQIKADTTEKIFPLMEGLQETLKELKSSSGEEKLLQKMETLTTNSQQQEEALQSFQKQINDVDEKIQEKFSTLGASLQNVQKEETSFDNLKEEISSSILETTSSLEEQVQSLVENVAALAEKMEEVTTTSENTQKSLQNLSKNPQEESKSISTEETLKKLQPFFEKIEKQLEHIGQANAGDIGKKIESLCENFQKLLDRQPAETSGGTENLEKIGEVVEARIENSISKIEKSLGEITTSKDLETLKYDFTNALEAKFWHMQESLNKSSSSAPSKTTVTKSVDSSLSGFLADIKETFRNYDLNALENRIIKAMEMTLAKFEYGLAGKINERLDSLRPDIKESVGEKLETLRPEFKDIGHSIQDLQKDIKSCEEKIEFGQKNTIPGAGPKLVATCPKCKKDAVAPASFQGKKVTCRHCRQEFVFPQL